MRRKRAEVSAQAAASSVYPDNNLLKTMVSYYSARSGQYRQADNFEANLKGERDRANGTKGASFSVVRGCVFL